jgi:3-hydroxyacyl-CoA dehydrogenase/enoyl-CoA hydratase/3-hydroxybutyryl-CoA epimerase/enoyl-CoA isomerase
MAHIAEASEKFAHLGKAYELTDGMKDMLANGKTYY